MSDPVTDFIQAGCVPRHGSHAAGTLHEAERIRAAEPGVGAANIYTAAILGDEDGVSRWVGEDRAQATRKGGPYGWDALTHLCFSRYLRLDRGRGPAFWKTAKVLLDAGASAQTGFFEEEHSPKPEFESVLYGAAGLAHDPELTRLLLEHGADPNDGEVAYHTPEHYDNRALGVLLECGRLSADSLAIMLVRKADWHDYEGLKMLLDYKADPNHITGWGLNALHQAVRRDNAGRNVELLLDHGAEPLLPMRTTGDSALTLAARRGRGDLLNLLASRGQMGSLGGLDRLLAACARDFGEEVRSIMAQAPHLVDELKKVGGVCLAEFSGNGNTEGVRQLLDLGVDICAPYAGDGYYGIAKGSTALHVAAWRIRPAVVELLVARGAPIDAVDGEGRTALQLAVRGCVGTYWSERRSPRAVKALLKAGASTEGVLYPSGYAEVDELLKKHGGVK